MYSPPGPEIAVGIALVRRPPALFRRSPARPRHPASPASLTVHPPPSSALEVPRSGRDAAGGVHAGADGGGGRPRARRLTPLSPLSPLTLSPWRRATFRSRAGTPRSCVVASIKQSRADCALAAIPLSIVSAALPSRCGCAAARRPRRRSRARLHRRVHAVVDEGGSSRRLRRLAARGVRSVVVQVEKVDAPRPASSRARSGAAGAGSGRRQRRCAAPPRIARSRDARAICSRLAAVEPSRAARDATAARAAAAPCGGRRRRMNSCDDHIDSLESFVPASAGRRSASTRARGAIRRNSGSPCASY